MQNGNNRVIIIYLLRVLCLLVLSFGFNKLYQTTKKKKKM